MEKYDELIGESTSYIVGQARLLHENFVEGGSSAAAYKAKLKEIIRIFDVGLKLASARSAGRSSKGEAGPASAGRRTRKRKSRNH